MMRWEKRDRADNLRARRSQMATWIGRRETQDHEQLDWCNSERESNRDSSWRPSSLRRHAVRKHQRRKLTTVNYVNFDQRRKLTTVNSVNFPAVVIPHRVTELMDVIDGKETNLKALLEDENAKLADRLPSPPGLEASAVCERRPRR